MACSYGIYDNLAFTLTLTVAYSLDIPIYERYHCKDNYFL